jgi:hypothetical protein
MVLLKGPPCELRSWPSDRHNDVRAWVSAVCLVVAFPSYLVGLRSRFWSASLLGLAYLGCVFLNGLPRRTEDRWYVEMYLLAALCAVGVPRKNHPISEE